ncbi:MAG: serine/threonine-protein kinase [Polyangiaceae bacterium]
MLEAAHEALPGVGRYSLHGRIAAGGMATVYLGRMSGAVGFSRVVAVKRMLPRFAKDPDFVAMFLDEAALASRVQHPNVVPTLDVVAEQGEVFIVMEYVRGQSLGALLNAAQSPADGGGVPVDVAASIICGVLAGLHAAHEARDKRGESLHIVHRDVSPHNVLVGADGVARIMDFGVAKAAKQLHITQEGQLKGKLAYMEPELIVPQGPIDRGVDVFAAAVVLWGMLAGRPLFRGQNLSDTVTEILSAPIPALCTLRSDVPEALDRVVQKGLARDRASRWATAQEFESAIEAAVPRIASARVVGAWVERFAGEVLAEREKQVAAVDSSALADLPPPPPSVPAHIPALRHDVASEPGATSMHMLDTPRLTPRHPLGASAVHIGDAGVAAPMDVAPRSAGLGPGLGVDLPLEVMPSTRVLPAARPASNPAEPGRIRASPARMALYVGVGVVSMSAVLLIGLWGAAPGAPTPSSDSTSVVAAPAELPPTEPTPPAAAEPAVPAEAAAVEPPATSATAAAESPSATATSAPAHGRPGAPRRPPPPKATTTPTATDPRYFPERP